MTDKKQETNDLDLDKTIVETTHKVEDFYNNNKKAINYALIAIVGVIAVYFSFKQLYLKPLEDEAQTEIYRAQQYFEKDSFALAFAGNDKFKGFEAIVSDYGMSKAGNLANYYAGICQLRLGNFAEAVDYLNDFETSNTILNIMKNGALGDAYVEQGELSKGADHYVKAAKIHNNKTTSPIFLKKAGIVFEEMKEYADALEVYETIKKEYNESTEASDIEKYIARAQALKEGN